MIKLLGLLAFLFVGTVLAGTVILTGTCTKVPTSNTILFSLQNSGNDTAYSLTLQPVVSNAVVIGNYSVSKLPPGSEINFTVRLANITARGIYGDYFIVAYEQGVNFFTAAFPCLLSFGNFNATSQILENAHFSAKNSSLGLLNVTLFNAGRKGINATVSVILPPFVSTIGNSTRAVYLSPFNTTKISFKLDLNEAVGLSFSGAVVASYYLNGLHFASLVVFKGAQPKVLHMPLGSLIVYGAVAVTVLFVFLIIFVTIRSKAKKSVHREESKEAHGV